jgi:hypothetical protein
VWQGFINVSQSFSYKDSLFILATQGTNKCEHWTTTQKHPNLAACWGKIREVKKVRKSDENCAETLKKQPNFYARKGNVRSVLFTNKPMILLVCKEWYGSTLWFNPSKVRFGFWRKISPVQSYVIEHKSKSNHWIELKLYQKIPEVLVYVVVLIQMNRCLGRTCDIG